MIDKIYLLVTRKKITLDRIDRQTLFMHMLLLYSLHDVPNNDFDFKGTNVNSINASGVHRIYVCIVALILIRQLILI